MKSIILLVILLVFSIINSKRRRRVRKTGVKDERLFETDNYYFVRGENLYKITNISANSAERIWPSNAPDEISIKGINACSDYCFIVTGKRCSKDNIVDYYGHGGDPYNTFEVNINGKKENLPKTRRISVIFNCS